MSGTAADDRLGWAGPVSTMHQMCMNLQENTGRLRISLFKRQNKSPLLHILLFGERRAASPMAPVSARAATARTEM